MTDGTGEDRLAHLGPHFEELRALLMSARGGLPDPERVVRFAAAAVPHAEHCGLTLVRDGRKPATIAATDAVARGVDAIQYVTGEGPCLDVSDSGEVADVAWTDDLAVDEQWPRFGPRCVAETGVRSMFSIRLVLAEKNHAAMNFYAARAGAFDAGDIDTGAIFAPFAAMSLQSVLYESEAAQLNIALHSSRQIGTAIGILMARHRVTSEQAFAQLVAASQRLNRKLRDIAQDVERTGALPDLPAGPGRRGRRSTPRDADPVT